MLQDDTLALLGLGFAVFFGALQISPRNRFLHIFIIGGEIFIAIACGKLIWDMWESHPLLKLLIGAGAISLGVIAGVLAMEAYRSSNLYDYIFLWERNAENWDNSSGRRDVRLRLTGKEQDGAFKPVQLQLAKQKCPAKFTPVVQSQYDSLEKGVSMWITILGKGLKFDDTLRGEWRPVLNDTSTGSNIGV